MQLKQRIDAFVQMGAFIGRHFSQNMNKEEENLHLGLTELIKQARIHNGWFTEEFCILAIKNVGNMLSKQQLEMFTQKIPQENKKPKVVAVICAGNIPMVGFHDMMCVLLTGHTALIKLSSDDNVLPPFFLKLLCHYQPEIEQQIRFADAKLSNFDAVIATGSNNSANYFSHYFGKYPHIIRKNRSSVAVLEGDENITELKELAKDIFYYYGLGCRNVSQLLVPEGYDFSSFFEAVFDFAYVADNKKYANNYEYNRAVFLLNKEEFLDNNFLILKRGSQIHAPVSVLNYSYYQTKQEVSDFLQSNKDQIQCVLGRHYLPLGNSQCPVITDFADGVNTLEFLVNL